MSVPPVHVPATPKGLTRRGRALWRDLHTERDRAPDESVLILEACRLVGRLDDLDKRLRAEWSADLAREARQGALTLRGLVAELRLQKTPGVSRGGAVEDTPPVVPPDGLVEQEGTHDELAARRTQGRFSDPAG